MKVMPASLFSPDDDSSVIIPFSRLTSHVTHISCLWFLPSIRGVDRLLLLPNLFPLLFSMYRLVCRSLTHLLSGADCLSCRLITLVAPEDINLGIDLRTLRAIRVLRPLKLVSGVPSE